MNTIDGMDPMDPGMASGFGPATQPPPVVVDEDSDAERKQLVESWVSRVQKAEHHWEGTAFKRMRNDASFASGKQWPGDEGDGDDRYVANIIQRHLTQRTASLYAKNPRFIARRRARMDFRVWDERPQSLAEAMQTVQASQQAMMAAMSGGGVPAGMEALMVQAQEAMAVIKDAEEGKRARAMLDRVGRTLEVVLKHQVAEQMPVFKKQCKAMVRRALTLSAAWISLGFERVMEPRPEDVDKIRDATESMAELDRRIAAVRAEEGDCAPLELERSALKEQLRVLESNPQQLIREGLVFDFPSSTSVIVDTRCRQLQGLVGARWIAQRFLLSPAEVKRTYGIDIADKGFTAYNSTGGESAAPQRADHSGRGTPPGAADDSLVKVYAIQDKVTRQTLTVADGCPVFLREPAAPDIELDRFWTLFPLTFNDIENEKEIYPPSDVSLLRHMQLEHNRAREALREHRRFNVPGFASGRGVLSEQDKELLASRLPHSTIELDALGPTQKVSDVLGALPTNPIDPNLYETSTLFDDVMKVMGVQEANIGGTSGATATETSVAETTRMASVSSNVDDLDDLFNELARAATQVLLAEFSEETVRKIAGPGAAWPQLSPQDIADEIQLEVEAGSSGKPNRAADIKNFTDVAPMLMQIPDISPEWLAREGIRRMDDRLDVTDAFLHGMPSIAAMNRMSQVGAGPPGSDPNNQGGEGVDNTQTAQPQNPQPNQGQAAGAARNPGQGIQPVG